MSRLCRHCGVPLTHQFLDLGYAPPSNAYLAADDLNQPEITYPLRLMVCDNCFLVQTEDFASADTFFNADYAYFSSTSKSWLDHAKRYTDMAIQRYGLGGDSFVLEVAANDGYLLRNFVHAGVNCLGIEPTDATADVAENQGVPILRAFFGEAVASDLAGEGKQADLIIGNNVYAHVPDINDFTKGLAIALKPDGVITLEFPHLMRLVEFCQFDTVYHEHFSYLSLATVSRIFDRAGLRIFDVEELPTHGGSLRIYGCHQDARHDKTAALDRLLREEQNRGMQELAFYQAFQGRVNRIKDEFLAFLLKAKQEGHSVVAYGAAAKGNTFLNFAGVRPDLIPCVFDAAMSKQGRYMPGSHIPILAPDEITKLRPDYVIILPWNIADEVMDQLGFLAKSGTQFVTAIPGLQVR